MLTEIQQKLLQMMKEIDQICRENDIHYALGGGTAIGAIRHRGFIPWDDDIDLYMTRDNWEKFKLAEREGKFPPNRVIESAETDIEYANTFGRYVTTDTSSIHSNQIIANDAGGHVIDIFVFDPIHIDSFWKFMEDYQMYSDLMNETMGFSTRFDMNIDRYMSYYKRTQKEGKKVVIDELIESFTHQDAPGWNHYVMEWGTAPFLFPASIYENGYMRVPFEDTTVEIMKNYSEYLTWQYGDEWQYIPKHEGREGHDAIFSNKIPYTVVRDDYRPFIDEKKLHKAYIRRKYRLMLANQHRRSAQIAGLKENGNKCIAELMAQLAAKHLGAAELRAMLAAHKYNELSELFAPYYEKQLSADFIGRHDKHSTLHRYYNPVLLDIDTEIFEIAVETLMRTERMSKAKRLIELYEGYNGEAEMHEGIRDNEKIEALKAEILEARTIINEYSLARTDELYERVNEYLEKYPNNSQIARLKIRMLLEDPSLDNDSYNVAAKMINELIDVLGKESVVYGELLKYREDIKACGAKLSAGEIEEYKRIYEITNNGFIKLEIEDKLAESGSPIEKDEEEEQQNTIVVRKGGVYSKKNSFYRIAAGAFKKLASIDDRVKERAWEIACRTRDRVSLLEMYENQLDELEAMAEKGKWDELEELMKPHEEAVLRNLERGLGLCVHPTLSTIQNEIFERRGEGETVAKIEALIPDQHRKPIGY